MRYPLIYEINTRCWLNGLRAKTNTELTLSAIPDSEFEFWKSMRFSHIWLMGVWSTGPRCRAKALETLCQRQSYDLALPGWTEADVESSAYAISDYSVTPSLGGDAALRQFREKLHRSGLKLMLDFVPNHLGLDHPWVNSRPELFIQSKQSAAGNFFSEGNGAGHWLAHGKDPYFAPWIDTAQLDYSRTETHRAMVDLLKSVAAKCDAVRCDMSMLLLRKVFSKTWQHLIGASWEAPTEFWHTAIQTIKSLHPEFLFLAEAYWGLEPDLQALGFDYTYEKQSYDFLVARDPAALSTHLLNMPAEVLSRSAHFIENHDEPRAATLFSAEQHRMAATLILSLPGMRLLHEGQLEGRKRKIPIQLIRRGSETPDAAIELIYKQLLPLLASTSIGQGSWCFLRPTEFSPGDNTYKNFCLIHWQSAPKESFLVVLNLGDSSAACSVKVRCKTPPALLWGQINLSSNSPANQNKPIPQNSPLKLQAAPYGVGILKVQLDS